MNEPVQAQPQHQEQAGPAEQAPEPIPEEKPNRFKRFIKEMLRVLRITKKPGKEEYKSLVKVTGIGAAVLGAIGFVLFLLKQLLF